MHFQGAAGKTMGDKADQYAGVGLLRVDRIRCRGGRPGHWLRESAFGLNLSEVRYFLIDYKQTNKCYGEISEMHSYKKKIEDNEQKYSK